MSILIVTEKASSNKNVLDGGAGLLSTLRDIFDNEVDVMQYGGQSDNGAKFHYKYPIVNSDRFKNRIHNAEFIANKVYSVANMYEKIIFIHVSMHFSVQRDKISKNTTLYSFPMFLTPSYNNSNEIVPKDYSKLEKVAMHNVDKIITPSPDEKEQLLNYYDVDPKIIKVIPRGIRSDIFKPHTKTLGDGLKICSVGSIKPQKNTIELIYQFEKVLKVFPKSTLKIIGANQNQKYYKKLLKTISELKLSSKVHILGYLSAKDIYKHIQDCHIHISMSTCETFGRVIFETLACGLPNIAMSKNNSAMHYLKDREYIKFIDSTNDFMTALDAILMHYETYSNAATEINVLYDDVILQKLLKAEFDTLQNIAISDYDGTLYHKLNPSKTSKMMKHFRTFKISIICSARGIDDLVNLNKQYRLNADWIISYSGSVISDAKGNIIRILPLCESSLQKLSNSDNVLNYISIKDKVIQAKIKHDSKQIFPRFREEIYKDERFVMHAQARKLSSIVWLLNYLDLQGRITGFGDGKYDQEWLTYFDGIVLK